MEMEMKMKIRIRKSLVNLYGITFLKVCHLYFDRVKSSYLRKLERFWKTMTLISNLLYNFSEKITRCFTETFVIIRYRFDLDLGIPDLRPEIKLSG